MQTFPASFSSPTAKELVGSDNSAGNILVVQRYLDLATVKNYKGYWHCIVSHDFVKSAIKMVENFMRIFYEAIFPLQILHLGSQTLWNGNHRGRHSTC